MTYAKAMEDKKQKIRRATEEKLMRKLGVKEDILKQLRNHVQKKLNSDQRFYRKLVEVGTYIET